MVRVLVADDDPTCLAVVAGISKAAGFQVVTATDGVAAWEKFEEHKPDMVITDHNMPRLTGLGLLKRIKDQHPHVPVVIFTSESDIKLKKKAWDAGVFDFLSKPVSGKHLTHVLKIAVAFEIKAAVDAGIEVERLDNGLEECRQVEELAEIIGVEAVLETIQQFVEQLDRDFDEMKKLSADTCAQLEKISQWAHRLKGAHSGLGLARFARQFNDLESMSQLWQDDLQGYRNRILESKAEILLELDQSTQNLEKSKADKAS